MQIAPANDLFAPGYRLRRRLADPLSHGYLAFRRELAVGYRDFSLIVRGRQPLKNSRVNALLNGKDNCFFIVVKRKAHGDAG